MKNKIIFSSLLLLLTFTVHAGLYRWVDDAGNVHFSDKVPVAASQKSHAKLNKSGDITKQLDPEAKQKELDRKEALKREKAQLAEIRRIKALAQAKIQQRDDNLLSTYENKDELIRFFENKIKLVEGNSKILEAQNKKLETKVAKLEEKAKKTKHQATLKNITKKMVNINQTIEQYKKALAENNEQIATITTNYQSDLARFKELTE